MQCLVCGGAGSVHDTRDIPYWYKGEQTSIPGIEGDFCPLCGEIILDRVNAMRVSAFVGQFMAKVDGSHKIASTLSGV